MDTLEDILGIYYRDKLEIEIRVERPIENFSEFRRLGTALQSIDAFTRRENLVSPKLKADSLELRAEVIRVRIDSPPILLLIVNPAWLAVFLALVGISVSFVGNYHNIRNNLPQIRDDIRSLIAGLKLLTEGQRRKLRMAAESVVDEILQIPEEKFQSMANRIRDVRSSLTINNKLPEVEVLKLEDREEQ